MSLPAQAAAIAASPIGDEAPLWIAVSPDYRRTRMVAVLAAAMGCTQRCMHLWVSRDGGVAWHDARLPFDGAHVAVLTDGSGPEALLVEASSTVERSDDDGRSWRAAGVAGLPVTVGDRVAVAVRGGRGYELDGRGTHAVAGSDGAATDLAFAASSAASSELLAVADPVTGAVLVERCDASLRCGGSATLPGQRSPDVSLVLDSGFDRDGMAVARTTTTVFRSTDAGRTFTPVPLPSVDAATYTTVAALSTAPSKGTASDRLYVALLGVVGTGSARGTAGGVYRSEDAGTTWHAVGAADVLRGGATTVAAAPDGRLFAGYVSSSGAAGLVCSPDGLTWASTCSSLATRCSWCAGASRVHPAPAVPVAAPTDQPSQRSGGSAAVPTHDSQSVPTVAATRTTGDGARYPVAVIAVLLALAVVAAPVSRRRRRRP